MTINLIQNLVALLLLSHQSNSLSVPSPKVAERQNHQSRRDAVFSILTKPPSTLLSSLLLTTTTTTTTTASAIAASLPAPTIPQDSGLFIPGLAGGAKFVNLIIEDPNAKEPWSPGGAPPSSLVVTNLGKARILASELSPLNPSLSPFSSDGNELYYDPFLFGAWKVTATLKRKVYPYGTKYLPSTSLLEGSPRNRDEQPGDSTIYEMHYFLPNNTNDDMTMIDKQKSNKPVIAEREFNTRSINLAYQQLSQVKNVKWDYKKDPTRLTIDFATLAQDLQPLGEKRAEIYFTARKSETGVDSQTEERLFCASERSRSVVVMPGNVVVSDTETITEFRLVKGSNGNHVKAVSRIAVYLTPNPNSREGILWQDVNGKAVAFYDYEIDMRRLIKVDENGKESICVYTPYGARQCMMSS